MFQLYSSCLTSSSQRLILGSEIWVPQIQTQCCSIQYRCSTASQIAQKWIQQFAGCLFIRSLAFKCWISGPSSLIPPQNQWPLGIEVLDCWSLRWHQLVHQLFFQRWPPVCPLTGEHVLAFWELDISTQLSIYTLKSWTVFRPQPQYRHYSHILQISEHPLSCFPLILVSCSPYASQLLFSGLHFSPLVTKLCVCVCV